MGILEKGVALGADALGLGGLFKKKTKAPNFGPDFPSGLRVQEIVNGKEVPLPNEQGYGFQLVGAFMPKDSLDFGGSQRIRKDYYPGHSEPVVQVLGPEEDDVVIHGTFKTKRFKDEAMREAAQEYQQLVDAVRIRGNIVKITLGKWRRYGFISSAKFKLKRLVDIDYEITFSIIGFNPPTNCKFLANADDDLIGPNKALTNAAAAALASARNYPAEMPQTLTDLLDGLITEVAEAINLVTGFVDGALTDVENLQKSATRAVGLIRNARATISRTSRRIGAIPLTLGNLTTGITLNSFKAAAMAGNTKHLKKTAIGFAGLAALLAALQLKFKGLSASTPDKRHLVKAGDTLQKLAVAYYNDQSLWKKIYDHNKLRTTALVVGSVLEIPKA